MRNVGVNFLLLNNRQVEAIKNLEKAFMECALVDLKFVGIDTDLCYTLGDTSYENVVRNNDSVIVKTYGSYYDSIGS